MAEDLGRVHTLHPLVRVASPFNLPSVASNVPGTNNNTTHHNTAQHSTAHHNTAQHTTYSVLVALESWPRQSPVDADIAYEPPETIEPLDAANTWARPPLTDDVMVIV